MSWTDRQYDPDRYGSTDGVLGKVLAVLNWSTSMGRWWGIDVRVSFILLFFIATEVLLGPLARKDMPLSISLVDVLAEVSVLFTVILLHEFGHCFACRAVGGQADEILMWPLGGLAFAQPPERPWPTFVTVAGGPLVNLVLVLLSAAFLLGTHAVKAFTLNPFASIIMVWQCHGVAYVVAWVFALSYFLLLLNLLPICPLDGGQMVQAILWPTMGNIAARNASYVVSMVAGGLLIIAAFSTPTKWLLIMIGLMGIAYGYQQRRMLKILGYDGMEDDQMDFSASLAPDPPVHHRHHLSRRRMLKARRQAQREQAEQARIDTILSKVSAHGLASLSWWERRALHKATVRQRKRDAELVRERE